MHYITIFWLVNKIIDPPIDETWYRRVSVDDITVSVKEPFRTKV